MGILLKPTQFVTLQKLLNPQADLRKAFGDVTERLIRFCSTSRELEGLLIEYLEPKLILWHDLTHSIIIFPRHEIIVIERRGICPLIWKRSWGFQLSIRSTRACLATCNNNRQPTTNFTACCCILLRFIPSHLNSYSVALRGYTEEMRDTKPKSFETTALDMNNCNSSNKVITIKSSEQAKLQRWEEEKDSVQNSWTVLSTTKGKAMTNCSELQITWQHWAFGNKQSFKMESCTASHLWTERVKEQ